MGQGLQRRWLFAAAWRLGLAMLVGVSAASRADVVHPLPYDLLYVRAPYFGAGPEVANSVWPDTVRPLTPDPGGQLVRLRRDGVREVLFPLDRYRSLIDTPGHTPLAAGSVADG
jgi:glyoxylase-like metal-dependent hydrolase (beta-lactamase superfamily II)